MSESGWLDEKATTEATETGAAFEGFSWRRAFPYIFLHVMCLGVFAVGWSWTAVITATALYAIRAMFITGFYHRYFSHRAFKTSRAAQFVFAVLAGTATQRGPLWWAAHHRHHHLHSDEESDSHSPKIKGFMWAHIGWLMDRKNFPTNTKLVPDLAKYPELVFLNRHDMLVPALFAAGLFGVGRALERWAPGLGVTGGQMLIWGYFVSTCILFHVTSCINSLAHTVGGRRYETKDDSRNNWLLAILAMGEGWHNNHHHYPVSARQGFFWWEIDVTYYMLWVLQKLGIIWELKAVPESLLRTERRQAA